MKTKAVFLALCMVVSAFALVLPTVTAHETAGSGSDEEVRLVVMWIDDWMEDDPGVIPTDEQVIFNYDNTLGSMYYLGDTEANVQIQVWLDDTDNLDNVVCTLQASGVVSIVDGTDSPAGVWNGGNTETFDFTVDIGTSDQVEMAYPLTLTIDYDDITSGQNNQQDTFDLEIFISSIFDDASTAAQRDIHDDLPMLDENVGDTAFEAGETFQEGVLTLEDFASGSVTDLTATFDDPGTADGFPAEIGFTDQQTSAVIPTFNEPPPPGASQDIQWWIDVAPGFDPGVYSSNIDFTYTRNGQVCTEEDHTVDLAVDYTPVVIADATVPDIAQGDKSVTIDVTFQNVGNCDLIEAWIRMSEISISAANDEFLFTPLDHYEGTTKKVTEWYQLDIGADDRFTFSDTETSTAVTISKEVDWMIPPGDHKVLFEWMGWYFNDGRLGDPSEFQHVVQTWGTEADDDAVMHNPQMWKDEAGNGLYPDDPLANGGVGNDVLDGDPWQDGAYIWITSTDTDLDLVAWLSDDGGDPIDLFAGYESGPGNDDNDVSFREIYVTFENQEMVAFKEMVVTLATGPGQPFLNPVDHALTSVDMYIPDSDDDIDEDGGQATFAFFVDINVAWWQSDAQTPGVYEVPATVEATNEDTGVRITPTTLDVMMNINGFGPELFASMLTTTDFKNVGDEFTLSVEITNYGDDIAREVDAYLMAPFVSGWTILDQFSTSISSYGGTGANVGDASWGWSQDQWHMYWVQNTQWNRSNDIKPSDVGVDNVPQIVELYDWIKRRESPPQGELVWMHLDRLGPGETYTFVFNMVSDVNMVEGMVYYVTLDLYYVDSNGNTYGPHGPMGILQQEDIYTPPQELLIRKGKGTEYAGEEELDLAVVIAGIIIAIVILIFFLLGTFIGGRGKSEGRYEPDTYSPPGGEYEPDMPPEGGDEGPPFPEEEAK